MCLFLTHACGFVSHLFLPIFNLQRMGMWHTLFERRRAKNGKWRKLLIYMWRMEDGEWRKLLLIYGWRMENGEIFLCKGFIHQAAFCISFVLNTPKWSILHSPRRCDNPYCEFEYAHPKVTLHAWFAFLLVVTIVFVDGSRVDRGRSWVFLWEVLVLCGYRYMIFVSLIPRNGAISIWHLRTCRIYCSISVVRKFSMLR